MLSILFNRLVALLTSCGLKLMFLVGVLALGVVDRGVPGILLEGEVTMLDDWPEDVPLM